MSEKFNQPNLPAAPESPDSKETDQAAEALTRRGFLQEAAKFAAAVAGFGILRGSAIEDNGRQKTRELIPKEFQEMQVKAAIPVATVFAGLIGASMAGKTEFNSTTAAIMNFANGIRLAYLGTKGGEQGKDLVTAEGTHTLTDFGIAVGLAKLSSFTTEGIQIDVDSLMEQERFPTVWDNRPDSDDSEGWEAHAQKMDVQINVDLGKMMGIAQGLAPFGTTYISSTVINNLKSQMLRLLYEREFALLMAANSGEAEKNREEALKAANKKMNGRSGFDKLVLAVAANQAGAYGIGDPPEIFLAARHANKFDEIIAESQGLGLLASETGSMLLSRGWLQESGIKVFKKDFFANFGLSQASAIQKLFSSAGQNVLQMAHQDQISRATKNIQDRIKDIEKRLTLFKEGFGDEETKTELENELQALNEALVELPKKSFRAVEQERKPKGVDHLGDAGKILQALTLTDFKIFSQEFKHPAVFAGIVKQANRLMAGTESEHLKTLFQGFQEKMKKEDKTERPDAGVQAEARKIIDAVGINTLQKRAQEVLTTLDLDPSENKSVAESVIKRLHRSQIESALTKLTEDSFPEALTHDRKTLLEKLGINHIGAEVLWALLTQIPAVASAVTLANEYIPKAIGIKEGEQPSETRTTLMIASTLLATAVMSATADNAAAYMFCEDSLLKFFTDKFGENVFETAPELKGAICAISAKMAEYAGSLTKYGNGPNFSQKEMTLVLDDDTAQGIKIKEKDLKLADSLNNTFAWSSAGLAASLSTNYIMQAASPLFEKKAIN